MPRFLSFLLVTVLLSVTTAAAQEVPEGTLPLEVVGSVPAAGEELALDAPITFFFDRPVDCASASAAFSISPSVPGSVTCDEEQASLSFTPRESYAGAAEYTVRLDPALRAVDGGALAEAFTLAFSTRGFLAVSDVLPAPNSTEITVDAVITVVFNRPVVPLVIAEEMSNLPQPLRFDPEVPGEGEWINTSIYLFRPEALGGGLTYTVTVDPALTAVDGAQQQEPFTWSFTTAVPQVTQVFPIILATDVRLDEAVGATFNQPVDRESVERAFSLTNVDTGEPVQGTFEWNEESTTFRFEARGGLEINTRYDAALAGGQVRAKGGGAPMSDPYLWGFMTVPYPAIIGTNPHDGEENAYPYGGITLFFASPMNVETLEGKITIDPEPWREYDAYYSDWDNSYTVSFPTEPSTDYTITIAPGMEDIYGNAIQEPLIIRYRTAPYDPEIALQVPGDYGYYNAYNEATQLFLTHRNITEVDLALYRVDQAAFVNAVASEDYYNAVRRLAPPSNRIRAWTIPSEAPENRRRYELLDLGSAGSVDCPGAMESRLRVGDLAVVVSDPDPLRVRAEPLSGEILTLLYRDARFAIVGGPVCAGEMLWWEMQLRDDSTGWVAEGADGEYFIDVAVPSAQTAVDVAADESGALAPGIYLLTATSPETVRNGWSPLRHVLVVATANLTMKQSLDELLVWATDMNTGLPIPDAALSVYGLGGELLAAGATDSDGLARFSLPHASDLFTPRVAVLQTGQHFGMGVSQWTDGIEAYNFNVNSNFYPDPYIIYLYTDRPVYRPDQPVYYRGVVRERDDVTYTRPDFSTIQVEIYNENGDIVYEETASLTAHGTFSGQFNIAADAGLGYYRLSAVIRDPSQQQAGSGRVYENSISFGVAEYRAPEYQVTVTPAQAEVVQGDDIEVTVEARYFFGGVVSGARVEYSVISRPYYFDYAGGRYSFDVIDYDAGPSEFYFYGGGEIARGEGVLDENGQLVITVPAELEDEAQSLTYTIEAVITDESGQAVAGRTDVVVHKGLFYVGVAPASYVANAGQEAQVDLIAVDWDSQPVPNADIAVTIVERRWSSVQELDETGRTTWTYEVEDIPVAEASARTDERGEASITFTPPLPGTYRIIARAVDARDNAVAGAAYLWASGPEYVAWRQQNSNRIDLITSATDYAVGDTAEILIASPFQGTTEALITIERGSVLSAERVTLTSNSYVYRFPITEDHAPTIFVSVVIVKGVDETNPVAAFRMGIAQLNVDNARKAITIEITPDREQAGPGDEVLYTVRTTDYAGQPVQAEVGVGLTDLAVLTLAAPNSQPMLSYFYGQQALSVRTSTGLTINTDQLTQVVLDTIKGGGGGFGEGGIFDIREEFIDTPYWNASLLTDENGEAQFVVTLPDNLTTWRLDARAVTSGDDGVTLVGEATFDLLSTKPLLIRPVTPRFMVVDDRVMLAALVNNNTDAEQVVDVSLQAEGLTLEADATQTVTIPAGGRMRVEWPARVGDVQAVGLTFFAATQDGAFTDASKPPLGQGDDRTLPVYRYEVPEVVGTSGLLRESGSVTEAIALPRTMEVTAGTLTINLDHSLATAALDGLTYLQNFKYQCIEQTVSRFLPNIMTQRAFALLGVSDPELERQLEEAVNFALQALYASQHVDGGWGWYVNDRSSPLTTAYALIGLVEAQNSGFSVSQTVIDNAISFLRGSFIVPSPQQLTWRLNRQAFVLYALARAGAADVNRMMTLFEFRDRLSLDAKAMLAMGFYFSGIDDRSATDALLSDLNNAAIFSATGVHWEEEYEDWWNWSSDTRTTALALAAFIRLNGDSDLIPNIVRWLMSARTADAWETTQETAWAVMALTDWMVASGELNASYTYGAALNGETVGSGAAAPENARERTQLVIDVAELLADEVNRLVIERSDGAGALYYTAHLRAFLPVPQVEPLNRGIILERRYTLLDDESGRLITEARVGDVVQARLTIIAPNDLHYVVIVDPIPAGTDAVNPNLETSQQVGTQPELNRTDPLSQGWGWWWFSQIEFRDESVNLYAEYLPAGTYEFIYSLRAGLPGEYNVIPATGQEFYFPEVHGRSAGSVFTILPEGA